MPRQHLADQIVRRARYHRIRDELLVAILRATPDEERPSQFLNSTTSQGGSRKGRVEVNPVLQNVKRVFDGGDCPHPNLASTEDVPTALSH